MPDGISAADAIARLTQASSTDPRVAPPLQAFVAEYRRIGTPFAFGDCSVGNLVFAGMYLEARRDFNRAVDAYCALVGLPEGLIENVTDGRDAHLVALDASGRILHSEEAIVDARRQNTIKNIFLIDRPLTETDARSLDAQGVEKAVAALEQRRSPLALNPRLAAKIAAADVIIYAPGTQHSSLFPSYLTPGLSDAIAANLRAIKLLVTNIQTDAEITGSTAVDLIDRALYYLNLKGQTTVPTPCLITHYLVNEPGRTESAPYVPLGPIETIEDPRLVRIGAYEDGVTGRHDAARILGPVPRCAARAAAAAPHGGAAARRRIGQQGHPDAAGDGARWRRGAAARDCRVLSRAVRARRRHSSPGCRSRSARSRVRRRFSRRSGMAPSTTSGCSSPRACIAEKTSWRSRPT